MKLKKVVISIFLLLNIIPSFAEELNKKVGVISGKITYKGGEPAVGVLVGIVSINSHSATDKDGNFSLKNIPYGSYLLEALASNAELKRINFECKNEVTELSFEMDERKVIEIGEVNIAGKSEGQKFKDKGFAMNIINTDKMAKSSLQATDLLDRASGVRLRQSGGMGSDIQYNINGLSGSSIRIFIDGIPASNYGSSFSLSSIPPSMIERIEVYKGVVPAHLSADALGGAVNIVLKQSSINRLSTSYSYGSFNSHKGTIDGAYRDDKSGFTADASAYFNYTDNNYKVWGDEVYTTNDKAEITNITARRFHDSYQSAGVNANLGFTHTKWADKFLVGLLYSEMEKDIQHGATMEVVYGNRKSAQDTKMVNLRYEKSNILKNLDLSLFGSYSNTNRHVVDTIPLAYGWDGNVIKRADGSGNLAVHNKGGGEGGKATLASNLEQNLAGRLNLAYNLFPKHKISANIFYDNFTRDVVDPLLPLAEQMLTEKRTLIKGIVGFTYETTLIHDKLKLSLFYKYYMQKVGLTDPKLIGGALESTVIDRSINNDGFGGAILYKLLPALSITASGEQALRLPTSNEMLGNTSENIQTSYSLKPESSINFNVGAILNTLSFGKHNFSGEINFFYRDIKDMIYKGLTNATDDMYGYENLGKVLSRGFDIDLMYNFNEKLFVEIAFSNFNARYNLKYDMHGKEYQIYGDRLRNAPHLTANGNISYIANNVFARGSRMAINYNIGYVEEFYRNWESLGATGKAMIPTQIVHDFGFVYTFPKDKVSLSFDIKNIFNEHVFDNWALQKPGRAFYLKLVYNIIN